MESLIRDAILSHISKNKLLSSELDGFTLGRSCMINLLVTLEDITLTSGLGVDVILKGVVRYRTSQATHI